MTPLSPKIKVGYLAIFNSGKWQIYLFIHQESYRKGGKGCIWVIDLEESLRVEAG